MLKKTYRLYRKVFLWIGAFNNFLQTGKSSRLQREGVKVKKREKIKRLECWVKSERLKKGEDGDRNGKTEQVPVQVSYLMFVARCLIKGARQGGEAEV